MRPASNPLQYHGLPAEIRMMIWKLMPIPTRINFTPRSHITQFVIERWGVANSVQAGLQPEAYDTNLRTMAGQRDDAIMHDPAWHEDRNGDTQSTPLYETGILCLNRETHSEALEPFTSCTVFDFSGIFDDDLLLRSIRALPPIAHRMVGNLIVRRTTVHYREVLSQLSLFRLQSLTLIIDPFRRDNLARYSYRRPRPPARLVTERLLRWWSFGDTRQVFTQIHAGFVNEVILLYPDSNKMMFRAIDPQIEDRFGVGALCQTPLYGVPSVEWISTWTILGSADRFTRTSWDGQPLLCPQRLDPIIRDRFDGQEVVIITMRRRDV